MGKLTQLPFSSELRIARRAAQGAGRLLARHFRRLDALRVTNKHAEGADYVSRADRESEALIRRAIHRAFPHDSFLGEEGGLTRRASGRRWVVDPLDGTTNFLHGFPMFAVSIALEDERGLAAGLVLDVPHGELFEAARGGGARLNSRTIRVSRRRSLRHSLVGTGFPFRELTRLPRYMKIFEKMCRSTAGLRRPGSAALDLCYLACGRMDAFWEFGLSPWDVAAGALIIKEAGGKVTDLSGGPDFLKGDIAASNGNLHAQMMKIINER